MASEVMSIRLSIVRSGCLEYGRAIDLKKQDLKLKVIR